MKRHSLDALSLVFGLLFLGLGVALFSGRDVADLVIQFWPGALVLAGLALLFSSRRDDPAPVQAGPEQNKE